ncbi:MAG: hypothetical protein ACF8R7_07135 [Phycisphaerales bacterium JB039]
MSLRALLIASIAGAVASTASAQNALGDGTLLERNPGVGSGGFNGAPRNVYRSEPGAYTGSPAIRARQELSFRNSVVTGNALGGLNFRGDVGYTAPTEFRGQLGSDDLFSFRRDSFYSGLAGMGIRGTEALQYQLALTTGNQLPQNLTGSLTATRLGRPTTSGARAGAVDAGLVDLAPVDPADPAADSRGKMLWTLRSTAAFDADRRFSPTMLTTLSDSEGKRYGLTASPMRGVGLEPLPTRRAPDEPRGAPGVDTRIDASVPLQRFESFMNDREIPPAGPADGGAEPAAEPDPSPVTSSWKQVLDEISAQLAAAESGAQPAPGSDAEAGETGAQTPGGLTDPVLARREALQRLLDERTTEALRQAPGEYETLLRPSARDFDAYGAHMAAGERLLTEGRYFEAEERFTRALAAKSGDPLAAAGRVHAEIGAGLFISAALNLRELLTRHPELIGARYQAKLLPRASRLTDVVIRLRQNIERDPEGAMGRQSALLLAYAGFHTGDAAALRDGLEQMRAAGDEMLADVLEAVWAPAGAEQP